MFLNPGGFSYWRVQLQPFRVFFSSGLAMFALLLAMTLVADPSPAAMPAAMPTVIAVDSTTQLTLDLQFERIKLLEMETLMRESHPAVQLQKLRVVENEAALYAMLEKGHEIDEPQVNSCLDLLLEKTRAELANKSKLFTSNHPELALLELRLRAIQRVQARRVLFE